jgi:hypothetical protein
VVIGTRQLWYFPNVPISLPNSRSRCFLFLLLQSNSSPFHSCASFSIGFFYLILQRVRPLIYNTDIACKPEHSARNVNSPIVRRTAVNSTDTFPVPWDSSELRHQHAIECYHTGCLILRRVTHKLFLQEY